MHERKSKMQILGENGTIEIIETKPSKLLLKEGESANISCTSDQPWFFCLWRHPSGTKKCSLKEDGQYRSVCLGMENMSVHGDGNTCQLNMKNITVDDHGMYMCLLNQAELFHTDRAYVNVEVATPAKLEMKKVGDFIAGLDQLQKLNTNLSQGPKYDIYHIICT